jgi:hypothetical protein
VKVHRAQKPIDLLSAPPVANRDYAGETLSGCVLVQNTDNVKVQGIFKCHILSVVIFFSVSKVLPRFPAV